MSEAKLEVLLNRQWLKVSAEIFRAYTGPRRMDGFTYIGPIVPLGS